MNRRQFMTLIGIAPLAACVPLGKKKAVKKWRKPRPGPQWTRSKVNTLTGCWIVVEDHKEITPGDILWTIQDGTITNQLEVGGIYTDGTLHVRSFIEKPIREGDVIIIGPQKYEYPS